MPTELFQLKSKKRISKFLFSNDWFSLVPWSHNGVNQPYISKINEPGESEDVEFTFRFIGPIAIVTGRWVGP
jgi:hypothetical protein